MSQWQQLTQRFSQLQMREKALLLGVGVFLIVYLFVWFLLLPNGQNISQLTSQQNKLAQQVALLTQQHADLTLALKHDYQGALKAKIAQKQQQLDEADNHLANLSQGFIAADKMPAALSQLLSQNSKVSLLGFKVKPAQQIQLATTSKTEKTSDTEKQQNKAQVPVFFEHQMEVTLRGSYFNLRDYVRRIEQGKFKLLIKGLSYQVDTYPNATLTLTLATVSSNEEFMSL